MERRRFPRLTQCLPLDYSCRVPGSGEIRAGKGFSQNTSQGGIYFKCEEAQLDCGWRINLSIVEITHQAVGYGTLKFMLVGRVVRLEPPRDQASGYGVAVQFLKPMDLFGSLEQVFPGNGHRGNNRRPASRSRQC